jgi:hypothetical protein
LRVTNVCWRYTNTRAAETLQEKKETTYDANRRRSVEYLSVEVYKSRMTEKAEAIIEELGFAPKTEVIAGKAPKQNFTFEPQ